MLVFFIAGFPLWWQMSWFCNRWVWVKRHCRANRSSSQDSRLFSPLGILWSRWNTSWCMCQNHNTGNYHCGPQCSIANFSKFHRAFCQMLLPIATSCLLSKLKTFRIIHSMKTSVTLCINCSMMIIISRHSSTLDTVFDQWRKNVRWHVIKCSNFEHESSTIH